MGKIRINILRAMELLMDSGGKQTALDGKTLSDLRQALKGGDWGVIDNTVEGTYGTRSHLRKAESV